MLFPEDKNFFNFFLDGQKLLIREGILSIKTAESIDLNNADDSKVVIFVKIDEVLLDADLLLFIEKVMNSVQLKTQDYFIVNLKKYPQIQFSTFRKHFSQLEYFIFFGVQTLELGLNISLGEGRVLEFKNYKFIRTLSPEILKNDKQAKNILWTNLKTVFYNEN